MPFPEITDKDYSVGGAESKDVHEILDYAVSQWESRSERRKRLDRLYNSHNGIIDQKEIDAMIKMTGKRSRTKYVKYRLGRSKLKQLHGEFLEINLTPTVRTTNWAAQNRKMEKYKTQLGLALSKPYIEKARSMGYDVFSGMQIPDLNNKQNWSISNFKLENEIAMQSIIDDKMSNERLKMQFYHNFVDMTIAAEVFGKIERDINGIDTYRTISPKFALYEENVNDPFLKRSPYLGEVRYMYKHEIMTSKEFGLTKQQQEQLKNETESYSQSDKDGSLEMIDGVVALPVYTIQWKGLEPVVTKMSPAKNSDTPYLTTLSREYYEKNENKLKKEDEKYFKETGKHLIDKRYREVLWVAHKIGKNIYTAAKQEADIIQILNDNGIYNVQFDYCGMLFNTINGFRVSVQEVIYELEKIYDDIRFMMNRELRKIKGDTMLYDEAFMPKGKRFIDIIHDVSEDGIARYDSSAEGNRSGTEADSNKVGIGAINLGQSQSLMVLLNQAMDIERVMDRITGMNDNRIGLAKATSTATANVNNIEASRSMTYDLFYFMANYIELVLEKLCEKTKINVLYKGEDSRQFIFDDDQIKYLLSTKDLVFDNYGVSITDGKKERDILQRIEGLFPQEINAGLLRTKDVAKFYMETSFASAIKILDKAHEELAALRQQEERTKQETSQKQIEANIQMAQEDREDKQNHDKEMEVLRTEGKKEIEAMRAGMQATMDFQNNLAKASMQRAETSNAFE
jgi:hypothetical protein